MPIREHQLSDVISNLNSLSSLHRQITTHTTAEFFFLTIL